MKKFALVILAIAIIFLGVAIFSGGSKDIELSSSQIESLNIPNNSLDYSNVKKDGNNNYTIDLTYHSQLSVGNVNHIKTIIKNDFNKNNSINLTIKQFKPMNVFNYIFKNGTWSK